MSARRLGPAWLLCCTLLVCPPTVPAQEEPLELGLAEEVEVQLVLVDFLVLDRDNRTVPGLTIDDFLLFVNRKPIEINSLDLVCPEGAAAEPRPDASAEKTEPAETPPAANPVATEPRKIVLVFDYFHMERTDAAFDGMIEALDRWSNGDEQHMVVSLGQVVRLETPFTADLAEIRWALERMRNDPDLYGGNYGRITEFRFFDRLRVLYDLLEPLPGRKTIVLLSGDFQADGFFHDPQFREVSALATATRSAVYPVDTAGLVAGGRALNGTPELRRLANETGGRMTAGTNDLGLAYAKAHRDLGCTYTLGFYDRRPLRDKQRRFKIELKDPGKLRVVYPEFYVVRSREEKRKSLNHTAAMAPHMFESDDLHANLFVLEPRSRQRWRALFGAEIRLGPGDRVGPDEVWDFRGIVRKPNGTVVREFSRSVPMPQTDPATGENPPVSVFRELSLRPGNYVVSAILSDPAGETPRARTRATVLSPIPDGPFLIGPILGTRSGAQEVEEFEPLLVAETRQGEPLESLTFVCMSGTKDAVDLRSVAREVTGDDGQPAQEFDPVSFRMSGASKVACRRLVDPVATHSLLPGRYQMTAFTRSEDDVTGSGSAAFTIRAEDSE